MNVFNLNCCFNKLIQDEKSDIETLKLIDNEMSLIIAELKPERKLGAHYHTMGAEIYHVLEGEGAMEIGTIVNGQVYWEDNHLLKAGDVFEVLPNVVHRLANIGKNTLRLVFLAPPSHLSNDRIFI
jgi:mannose-6-phosphate isomerase-like protein (cupin superfamily)